MKARLLLRPFAFIAALSWLLVPPCQSTVVTFDDLFDSIGAGGFGGSGTLFTNVYEGLIWSNFAVADASRHSSGIALNGYFFGMVTPSNVAVAFHGNPAEVDATGTNFNFVSAYLTGAWRSNLNIEVQGFSGGNLLYDQTVVASATNPTLFTFNYLNIDRLTFNSFGGQYAGFDVNGNGFAMDNFSFEFIPEPSVLLLTGAGVAMLCAFHRRKRPSVELAIQDR